MGRRIAHKSVRLSSKLCPPTDSMVKTVLNVTGMISALSNYPKRHGNQPLKRDSIFSMRSSLVYVVAIATQIVFTAISPVNAGPVVAIHDSELTRALEGMPATNPGTPSGSGA